ncbi:hypothetical protein Hanom_Chr11g01016741 [Helianthus anomalus]
MYKFYQNVSKSSYIFLSLHLLCKKAFPRHLCVPKSHLLSLGKHTIIVSIEPQKMVAPICRF